MLLPCHWVGLSRVLTPFQMHGLMNHVSRDCLAHFERCRVVCLRNLMAGAVQFLCAEPVSWSRVSELQRHLYLPRTPKDPLCVECFGYVKHNRWVDWPGVPSVTKMRVFWLGWSHDATFQALCRQVVAQLPEAKYFCSNCEWLVPNMASDVLCEFCQDVEASHQPLQRKHDFVHFRAESFQRDACIKAVQQN